MQQRWIREVGDAEPRFIVVVQNPLSWLTRDGSHRLLFDWFEGFRRDYAVLGAMRNLKIIGIFARLWMRDGKPAYLDHIPRVWGHVRRDLGHSDLSRLRDWVDRWLPAPDAATLARVRAAA